MRSGTLAGLAQNITHRRIESRGRLDPSEEFALISLSVPAIPRVPEILMECQPACGYDADSRQRSQPLSGMGSSRQRKANFPRLCNPLACLFCAWLNGLPGDVSVQGFSGDIQLNSFQWGVGRAISSPTGAAGHRQTSLPSLSEIAVT